MFILIFNSVMLGFGLAMDAFSVSLANGFADHRMSKKRRVQIAFVYAAFQFAMPVIGWFWYTMRQTFLLDFRVLFHGYLLFFLL